MPYQHTELVRPKGINKDLSPYELPPEVWSDGRNITFRRHRTNRIEGYEDQFPNLTDTIIPPKHHLYYSNSDTSYWAYASDDSIYRTDGTDAGTLELGSGYSADDLSTWSSCNFNSLIVFNNKNDVPQVLDPVTGTTMVDMPFWDVPYSDPPDADNDRWGLASRCEVIRPYKNYLIAMDCYDDSGTRFSNMVRWSSPAQLGDAPPSWDPNIPGEQAGLYNLADTPGRVVDGLTLGDYFCVYKTDAVWLMQFVGGDFVFSFRKLFGDEAGCYDKDCIAEFDGKHFVLSSTGAYIHNGHTQDEIMEPWIKDVLFRDSKNNENSSLNPKVVADHDNQEIWVYFSSTGAGPADKAVIWNWEIGEWTIRELTGINHIAEGYIINAEYSVDDWDSDEQAWDQDPTIWNNIEGVNPLTRNLLFADAAVHKFYAGGTQDQLGEPLVGWVERIGIDFNDDQRFKYISRVTPHIMGTAIPLTVTLYAEDTQTGTPDIKHVSTFDPSNQQWVDCHVMGRYIGIKFEGEGTWVLTGYSLEWEPAGNY